MTGERIIKIYISDGLMCFRELNQLVIASWSNRVNSRTVSQQDLFV